MANEQTATAPADPINQAIAQAQAAAAAAAQTQATDAGALTTTPAPTAVAPAPAPGVPMTMDQMAGGMSVDIWIGVKEHGLLFGQDKKLVTQPVKVAIDLSRIAPCMAVKFGNPAQYYKTYDRVTEARGGSWAQALANAQRAAPGVREYRSCDIPMTVLEDVKDVTGTVVAETGKTLGHSTSTTNWALWENFYKDAVKAGFVGQTVIATLGFEKRTNPAKNIWGVVTFDLVGAAS